MIALAKSARDIWEEILKRQDVDISIQNRKGETAFHAAAASKSSAACQLLLAKPDGEKIAAIKDIRARTAKDVASQKHFTDVYDVLKVALPDPAPSRQDQGQQESRAGHHGYWNPSLQSVSACQYGY